jgi:hypothetical protein
MGFRLRRSARLGPLRFNFSSGGLSSISVGGRGASFNIPVNRSGGPRTTVGLPGTGLSWSVEHTPDRPAAIPAGPAAGLPNSRRLRPGQLDALKQSLLGVLRQELFAPGSSGEQLWEHGLVSRLLADGSLGARTTGLLGLIETRQRRWRATCCGPRVRTMPNAGPSVASLPCRKPPGWPLGGAGSPERASGLVEPPATSPSHSPVMGRVHLCPETLRLKPLAHRKGSDRPRAVWAEGTPEGGLWAVNLRDAGWSAWAPLN